MPVKPFSSSTSSTSSAADVDRVARKINDTCRKEGGIYKQYSCKYVSWDDAARGTVAGNLSCWGPNITDTYLKARSGKRLFTVRSDNWNEKLGHISADRIALVVGNTQAGNDQLQPVTLKSFLQNIGEYGQYAKVPEGTDLYSEDLDEKVSIRFQTTFLPIADEERGTLEFCTEAYNYNTHDDSDPRNLVVLGTTQGVAIQQDGRGAKRLMHHAVDADGTVRRHWLEAERSDHSVGGQQEETEEEREDAVARGKATASVIGIEAMGTRFNALLTLQVPLKQKEKNRSRLYDGVQYGSMPNAPMMMACNAMPMMKKCKSSGRGRGGKPRSATRCRRGVAMDTRRDEGESNAARVSRGSEAGKYDGLTTKNFERDPHQHMTVTIVLYNTVAGGVPKPEDVMAAIEDMEQLYKACSWDGRLADEGADFMKSELTVKDTIDIKEKVITQPYMGKPVANFSVFPTTQRK